MSETVKTAIFAVIAATVGFGAWFTSQQYVGDPREQVQLQVGKNLFKEFDPLDAAELKIGLFDEDTSEYRDFIVARDDSNVWTLPSKENYPADAAQQVSEAATLFSGLKVLGVASNMLKDRELFGVIEPDPETLRVGDEGVGTYVHLRDDKNQDIASLIIGKSPKDQPDLRYVREPKSDAIFVVELDDSSLSTDFGNWIDNDLLKVSSNDMQSIGIREYEIQRTTGGGSMRRDFDADLAYDPAENNWFVKSIDVYEGTKSKQRFLTDDEELSKAKVDQLKNTLDTLKIANVLRKPEGLAADLKAQKVLLDNDSKVRSLFNRGFIPQPTESGDVEILATSGEMLLGLNNGVEYVLRFGERGRQSSSEDEDDATETPDAASDALELDRFLLVTARLDESQFAAPILKSMPTTVEDMLRMEADERAASAGTYPTPDSVDDSTASPNIESPDEKAADEKAADDEETTTSDAPSPAGLNEDGNKADGNKADESKADESKADESKADESKAETTGTETNQTEDGKADGAKVDGADDQNNSLSLASSAKSGRFVTAAIAAPQQDSTAADQQTPPEADSTPLEDTDTPAPREETDTELKERLGAVREKIEKENQRLIDASVEKKEKAQRLVDELNARFANWYYEIKNSEFQKLKVNLDELITKKGANADLNAAPSNPGFGPGGFNPGSMLPPGIRRPGQ
jgi:hypothetical protein